MLVNIRGHEVSGICVINISPDSCIIGTIINEFGIKAFDFSYSKGKVKIFNIMSPIDKWYIRKIVKNDFSFLLSNILINYVTLSNKKRTLKKMSDGRILLENNRHKIIYTFLPLTENNETLK
jgi:predicted methyltransferase